MLTPAEGLGLGGLSLQTRIRQVFDRIPKASQAQLLEAIHAEATRRHLIYLRSLTKWLMSTG